MALALRILVLLAACGASAQILHLPLRSRVENPKGSGKWEPIALEQDLPVSETAILICDMWDNHWCTGAAQRVNDLARRMNPVLEKARAGGIQIVHSPSEVTDFYKDAPQRLLMLSVPRVDPPQPLSIADPPLPIDDSNGGCDTGDKVYKAWTRENALLSIGPNDRISDRGLEVYSFLRQRGIRNLLVMGVHTNMCVLNRSFAIKQMTKWGIHCALVRDLTDAMYNPKDRPFVSHERGTALVIEHIEKYWAPSVTSAELVRALQDAR